MTVSAEYSWSLDRREELLYEKRRSRLECGLCPECGKELEHTEGCQLCRCCGWSGCGS